MSNFQVGNRVRIRGHATHYYYTRPGAEGTIVEISGRYAWIEDWEGLTHVDDCPDPGFRIHLDNLELAEQSPEAKAERERLAKMSPVEKKIHKMWERQPYVKLRGASCVP